MLDETYTCNMYCTTSCKVATLHMISIYIYELNNLYNLLINKMSYIVYTVYCNKSYTIVHICTLYIVQCITMVCV